MGYIYKIWSLQSESEDENAKQKKICIRCTIHSHDPTEKNKTEEGEEEPAFMNIYALNEYNPNLTEWKTTIDQQIITCLNKEITNNSFKVTKWLV